MDLPEDPPGASPVETPVWQVQSDLLPGILQENTSILKQDLLTFHDSTGSNVGGLDYALAPASSNDQTDSAELDNFFKRPVRIADFTWNETDAVGTSHVFNPWQLYFADSRVQYKLNNYAFVQCVLKVKILINASPFYYGSMYCGYRPVTGFMNDTITNDTGTRYLIPYSQRPSVWLSPQRNEGAQIDLPMFYYQNFVDAQSAAAMGNMGQLTFLNYTTLQSANGASGTGVSVAVYAWAEQVKLSGPSLGLATQSDVWEVQADEYGKGSVSAPASALAKIASRLESVPIIGRFATATRMGASVVSSIASLFGYTNVPVIEDTCPYRPEPFPKFSSSSIGYPVEKLTLDPKNELSIDNSIVGADGTDELALVTLVTKESYLCTTTWTTAQSFDTILFSTPVTPCNWLDTDGATYAKWYLTPPAWVSAMFQNWRGDVIFRFRIVASQFHKGRLRISFDPNGSTSHNLTNDVNSSNVVFTEIIDLDSTSEVEFRVPYQQAVPFLNCQNISNGPTWDISTSPSFTHVPQFDNGTITVRVLTSLTAPIASSSVSILVFVRGAENLEFANPVNPPRGYSYWGVQSEVSTIAESSVFGKPSHVDDSQYLINFGEKISSLRQVLRRMSLVSVTTTATDSTNDYWIIQKFFTKIPPYFGYDTHGIHQAKGLAVPSATFPFNFTTNHPINWILPAYCGFRGSTNWSFNVDAPSAVGHVRAHRVNAGSALGSTNAIDAYTGRSFTKGSHSQDAYGFLGGVDPGCAGMALTNQLTNAGINITCPMYTRFKMEGTSINRATLPNTGDDGEEDMYCLEVVCDDITGVTNKGLKIWSYCGIGVDFSPILFLNVPTLIFIGNSFTAV